MYYQAYKNIDREQLELVNVASDLPRRQGRTFMFILQMLGEAWLGDPGNEYLYVGERFDHSHAVMREFAEILRDEGFDVERNQQQGKLKVIGPKPCSFFFIGPSAIERYSRGIRWADAFVDLTYETEDKAYRDLKWLHYNLEAYHA